MVCIRQGAGHLSGVSRLPCCEYERWRPDRTIDALVLAKTGLARLLSFDNFMVEFIPQQLEIV